MASIASKSNIYQLLQFSSWALKNIFFYDVKCTHIDYCYKLMSFCTEIIQWWGYIFILSKKKKVEQNSFTYESQLYRGRKLAKYLCTYAELPYILSNNLFVLQSSVGHNHVMFGPLDV
jgi:hypothetical protein